MRNYFEFEEETNKTDENSVKPLDEQPELKKIDLIPTKNKYSERKEKIKKYGFQEIDIREDVKAFSLESFLSISNKSNKTMSNFDKKYLKPGGFLPRFILIYFFHLFLLLPFLSIFLIFVGFKKASYFFSKKKIWKGLLCIPLYTLDSFLHISYILCFICVFLPVPSDNKDYISWNLLCFVLYTLYLLAMVFISVQSTTSVLDFFKLDHLKFLGYRLVNYCEKSLEKTSEDQNEKIEEIFAGLFTELNLDHSVFRFARIGDELSKEPNSNKIKNVINPFTNSLHMNAKNSGSAILHEIYNFGFDSVQNTKTFGNYLFNFFLMLIIVVAKVIFPLYSIENDLDMEPISQFCFFSVTLFFIQMFVAIYPLITCDDLKFKTFMIEKLISLINISKDSLQREMKILHKLNPKLSLGDLSLSPNVKKHSMRDFMVSVTMNQGDEEELIKMYLFEKVMSSKLDTTCRMSIETWDNCRKAAHQYGDSHFELYESVMLYLGLYSFFLSLVLLEVIYDIYVFVPKSSAIFTPFMINVFLVDLVLFLCLFLNRIYYGNMYNQTFLKEKRSVEILNGIYEDLCEFYDYYINDETVETDNIFYDILKRRIIDRKRQVESFAFSDSASEKGKEVKETVNKFPRNLEKSLQIYIKSICKTLIDLQKDIEKDSEMYSHEFLGLFPSDFKNTLLQLGMVMIPLVPSIYEYYTGLETNYS